MAMARGMWALLTPCYISFFFLSNFQTLTFSSHFSQELWGLEGWNLVHMCTVGRCIVCIEIRLLLLICPFVSSFFFLSIFIFFCFSNFQFMICLSPQIHYSRAIVRSSDSSSYCCFVLWFNVQSTTMVMLRLSVNLTTHFLGRLRPFVEMISWFVSTKECFVGSEDRTRDRQAVWQNSIVVPTSWCASLFLD